MADTLFCDLFIWQTIYFVLMAGIFSFYLVANFYFVLLFNIFFVSWPIDNKNIRREFEGNSSTALKNENYF